MSLVFKILAVTGPAMFAGIMLAISIILGGYWQTLPPEAVLDWFAQHDWRMPRAMELVGVPTLIGLGGMLILDWKNTAIRKFWLGAVACVLLLFALTIIWVLPGTAALADRSIPVDQVAGALDTWLLIHHARIALALMACVLGFCAVSR